MQHVNDDMDDLFKRAAENYPLKTDSADWNAVAKKLAEQEEDKPAAPAGGKNKHLLWLLLLLPLGGIYFYISGQNEKPVNTAKKTAATENKKGTGAESSNSVTNIAGEISKQSSLSRGSVPGATSNRGSIIPPAVSSNNSSALVNSNPFQRKSKGRLASTITGSSSTISSENTSDVSGQKTELTGDKKTVTPQPTNTIPDNKKESNVSKVIEPAGNEMKPGDENKLSTEKTTVASSKKNPKQKEHGLYAGILIGPDISTVKFQSIKKAGVSMGVLVGYQFNKRFSIESGVSWDIKNYYSQGEYFDKSVVYPNPNTKIKSVEGVCNMVEVPVMIKYNLSTNKNHISISGGLSSYIMKKEEYDYIVVYNNGQPYPHSSSYKNSSTDLLAVANFSVGYNRQVKKGVSLRVEPYIKIPIKGVGIGSLPIMSTGLNIGITKKLSR